MPGETAVTDEATERRIQDAAQVLLDVCHAAHPPPAEGVTVDPEGFSMAQTISLAVQALVMVDHLEIGKPIGERGAATVTALTLKRRFFGLGVGVGHSLASVMDPIGQLTVLSALQKGIEAGLESRGAIIRGKRP